MKILLQSKIYIKAYYVITWFIYLFLHAGIVMYIKHRLSLIIFNLLLLSFLVWIIDFEVFFKFSRLNDWKISNENWKKKLKGFKILIYIKWNKKSISALCKNAITSWTFIYFILFI